MNLRSEAGTGMLELLTILEHAALYLSLPVISIWSLVRGSPETKFGIWVTMSEYYFANLLKYVFHTHDHSLLMNIYGFSVDLVILAVIVRGGKSAFLMVVAASMILTWIAAFLSRLHAQALFWSAMTTSEFFTWVGQSCFALALLSDDRYPNAHWREVAKLARFWK